MYPSGTGSSFNILMLDCNLIFFCSGFKESSLRMSDMGLDLLRLLVSGNLERFCKAAAAALLVGDVGSCSLPSGVKPGNLGKGWGIPGSIIPGGKKGFCDSKRFWAFTGWGELVGEGRLNGCLRRPLRPKGGAGNPGGRPGIESGIGDDAIEVEGGGGEALLGELAGELFDVVVVAINGCWLTEVTEVWARFSGWLLSVGDVGFNNAARLLAISWGDACLFKWGSSLSFSVKPCN